MLLLGFKKTTLRHPPVLSPKSEFLSVSLGSLVFVGTTFESETGEVVLGAVLLHEFLVNFLSLGIRPLLNLFLCFGVRLEPVVALAHDLGNEVVTVHARAILVHHKHCVRRGQVHTVCNRNSLLVLVDLNEAWFKLLWFHGFFLLLR